MKSNLKYFLDRLPRDRSKGRGSELAPEEGRPGKGSMATFADEIA
jgi:hypothetical protein